ncbi:hypothetical protein G7070_04515 [Propioniciclava coleopterorum]|uniref:SAF domain-containing protein n=1 Tax=Propioniciclava coleopterorum TaxID=2714937 RepID=A0A6G7Y4S4_9ACTN|nr:SAF domain-containing protein [Propioniciclava coleopterorum]QIK71666.1 hypothetical protein G7070_04515 [Propioniciclava coleopterorum]
MKPPRAPLSLPRFLRLRRRPLAALCTFVAVLTGLWALSPPPDDRTTVLVAGAALPAGTVLGRGDLVARPLPPEAVPEAAITEPDALVGRALAGPVTAGTVLTEASVASGERLARPGMVVIALPLPSGGIAALVRPGAEIDLIASDGATVAGQVRVLSAPETAEGFGAASRAALIEVSPDAAARLAQLAQTGSLTIAVR